jgi:hypothetical protein
MAKINASLTRLLTLTLAVTTLAGCSFLARDKDRYRDDTQAALDTRASGLRACWDAELAANPGSTGELTLHFTVEKKTGTFTNVTVVPEQTNVSKTLQDCVIGQVEGLALEPDRRDGDATFSWTFRAPQG